MLETTENAVYFTGSPGERGLHARNAAFLIRWVHGLDARITVRRVDGPTAKTLIRFACDGGTGNFLMLSSLGVPPGARLEFTATGPDAQAALYGVRMALREEPPRVVSPSQLTAYDRARLEAWGERMVAGAPQSAPRRFREELLMWMRRVTRSDFAELLRGESRLRDLAERRLREAMRADKRLESRR